MNLYVCVFVANVFVFSFGEKNMCAVKPKFYNSMVKPNSPSMCRLANSARAYAADQSLQLARLEQIAEGRVD